MFARRLEEVKANSSNAHYTASSGADFARRSLFRNEGYTERKWQLEDVALRQRSSGKAVETYPINLFGIDALIPSRAT